MRLARSLVSILLVLCCWGCRKEVRYPEIHLELIREGEAIEELDNAVRPAPEETGADATKAIEDYHYRRVGLVDLIRPAQVKALSEQAREKMEAYGEVPALEGVEFESVGVDPEGKILYLEGVLDDLPGETPEAGRRAVLILKYDRAAAKIVRIWFTIR